MQVLSYTFHFPDIEALTECHLTATIVKDAKAKVSIAVLSDACFLFSPSQIGLAALWVTVRNTEFDTKFNEFLAKAFVHHAKWPEMSRYTQIVDGGYFEVYVVDKEKMPTMGKNLVAHYS